MSHYQGNVFWEAIGNNGRMYYVYLKASEGGDNQDKRYVDNIRMAKASGLKVGSYHFYRPTVDQELQVANFFAQCKPSEQDLIPMIDVEVTGGLSTEALCDSLFKFLDMIEQVYRQRPLIYAGANFYNKHLQGKLDRYLIMIAQYSNKEPVLADGRDVTMWQYTGKGHLHGINGYVDKSRFMGEHKLRELRFRHRKGEP
jgi:lysozyme